MGIITAKGALQAKSARANVQQPQPSYLAGPMSGIDQLNFPAFYRAAERLRGKGLHIINPAELDDIDDVEFALQSNGEEPMPRSWGEYLARDVELIANEAAAIIVLPGWEYSKGARLECFVGLSCDMPVYLYNDADPVELDKRSVLAVLSQKLGDTLTPAQRRQ